jgi:hypothetical protein
MTYQRCGVVCDRCGSAPIIKGPARLCPAGGTCVGVSERHADSPEPILVPPPVVEEPPVAPEEPSEDRAAQPEEQAQIPTPSPKDDSK